MAIVLYYIDVVAGCTRWFLLFLGLSSLQELMRSGCRNPSDSSLEGRVSASNLLSASIQLIIHLGRPESRNELLTLSASGVFHLVQQRLMNHSAFFL
ncbi:hypothetical protein AVEN_153319-1 [Araneus ventricosus]|uniref:Uncharacterized protein n=1 Tax=Araneus ventricosus TaxID=182803 RepID=A0A4Y1ZWR1_ARAVE|nr:hypothetical protein AVEN_153319-1 [Araneus ventricosus]